MSRACILFLAFSVILPSTLWAEEASAPVPLVPALKVDGLNLGTGKVDIVYDVANPNQMFFRLTSMPEGVTWFQVDPSTPEGERFRNQVDRAAAENRNVGAYSDDTGKVRAFFMYAAAPVASNTQANAERAKKETLEFLSSNAEQFAIDSKALSMIDLSYITPALLDEYEQSSQPKAAGCCGSSEDNSNDSEAAASYCYYGHHFVWNASTRTGYWKNSNYSSGCDSSNQRCWGNNSWRASLSNMRVNPGTCPRNSQGYGSTTFKGN